MNAGSRSVIQLFLLLSVTASVQAQLNANFTVDKSAGCSPLTVTFTNRTSGASAGAIYKWDLGNGNTSTLVNPAAVYTDEKTYTVTLTVQDGNQTASKTMAISVYKKPVADFSPSIVKGCVPLQVTFTSNSQAGNGSISGYYWDFGDGTTQQGNTGSQTHIYNLNQLSAVSLTVFNSFGCHATIKKKDLIETLPAVTAAFSSDKTMLCKETDAVQFTNASTGPGVLDYSWDFGDGNTSNQKDPGYAFNKKGTYTVKLTVNSSEGCTVSKTQTDYLNVANYSSGILMPARVCAGNTDTFYPQNSPVADKMIWKVNDQVIAPITNNAMRYTFGAAGAYLVKLVNTFGNCLDSVTKQVEVKDVPDIRPFVADIVTPCGAPATVNFKDTTPGAVKWEWRFENNYNPAVVQSTLQAPTYVYNANTTYTVLSKIWNGDGCANTITKTVRIDKPSVRILYTSSAGGLQSCGQPLTVTFFVEKPQDMASYEWDFGDKTTSTDASPTHTYTNVGTYRVALKYVTVNGCSDRIDFGYVLAVTNPLKADFESRDGTTICGNNQVYFKNTSTGGWSWWFVDGKQVNWSSSPKQDMIYRFTTPGKHTIALTVEWNGCYDKIEKTDYITVLPPIAKIDSVKYPCAGNRAEVIFYYKDPGGGTWTWDYGDGTTETLTTWSPTITHTYAKSGIYRAKLKATDGQCQVSDSIVAIVVLKQYPQVTAAKTGVCENEPLKYELSNIDVMKSNFFGHDTYTYYEVVGYSYNTGVMDAKKVYIDATSPLPFKGTIEKIQKDASEVRVIIRNQVNWCNDTSNYIPVTITGSRAGFEVLTNNVCYKDAVAFKDTSKSNNSTITSWQWDFGDGQTSTQNGTVSHVYNKPGQYNVTLKITDASGCGSATSSSANPVTVVGPLAAFTPSGISVPLSTTVTFTNNTNNSGSPNTTYQWQVNGTDFSTGFSPSYTFDQPGSYTVTLTAANPVTGCSSTATQVITVNNFNVGFKIGYTAITANSCPPVQVSFTNTSQNYTNIKWDLGDGTIIENVSNPTHIYENAGKYIITLNVTNASGLQGTYIDSVIINMPQAVINSNTLEACKESMITLNAVASNTGLYVWDFGDGNVITTTDTFANHQYSTPGVYTPALIMKQSANGCTGATPLGNKINIRPDPVVTIAPAQPLICKGASVPLQATGGVTYEWLPAADLSSAAIANPVASPGQTSSYTVKVTDDIGCSNDGQVTITVIQPIEVTVTGKSDICPGESVNLNASGAAVYKWINDIAGLNNVNIPNPVATPGVTTAYTITGTDTHSCFTDTAEITIEVKPAPTVNAGPDVQPWPGEPVPLQAIGSNDVTYWQWAPATNLSCTSCSNPVCTPLTTSSYTVTVKNQYGCVAVDTMEVKLLCSEGSIRIPNGITPNGDGKNDVFMIRGTAIVKHLVIFNRWGQKVFDRSNFMAGDRSLCWDGTLNGQPAGAGTYVYFVEVDCPGGSFTKKGTLELVR
jgi:gliding motility-associated-like protein